MTFLAVGNNGEIPTLKRKVTASSNGVFPSFISQNGKSTNGTDLLTVVLLWIHGCIFNSFHKTTAFVWDAVPFSQLQQYKLYKINVEIMACITIIALYRN